MTDIILKFGKHKGQSLKTIPLRYFAWLLTKYKGTSITKEQLEKEAVRRGCSKRNGHWGIERSNLGSFDNNGFGYNLMYGVVREWNEDKAINCDSIEDDPHDYYGIPNSD